MKCHLLLMMSDNWQCIPVWNRDIPFVFKDNNLQNIQKVIENLLKQSLTKAQKSDFISTIVKDSKKIHLIKYVFIFIELQ